jgi:peptidoglycan/LPS O-acetylase OafA/YrhL
LNTTPPPLDIVSFVVALLSLVFSHQAAQAIGPYAVIVVCAIGGASWSAARIGEATTRKTMGHIALWAGLGVICAVPLAEGLARFTGWEVRWILGPGAALVAAHPDWIWLRVRALIDRRIGHQAGQGDQP